MRPAKFALLQETSMTLYAIEIMLQGSVHVKATSLEQADRILTNTSSNTVLGLDKDWFSDGPDAFRQRVTFSTRVKARGSLPGAKFVEVPLGAVKASQDRWWRDWHGLRCPYNPLEKAHEQVPVYSSTIDTTTTAFVSAASIEAAATVLTEMSSLDLDLLAGRTRWFSTAALGEGGSDLPVALSSALYLIGKSQGSELSQSWPDFPYAGPEFVTVADEFL
jgi:hypothetical protein